MKTVKLSIITINLNDKSGLQSTIKSVVSQTFNDYEYIVIDGASTDGSVEVIKEYQNQITCWISEPDSGIYNAMNKGILRAKGEYCLFLNSGDTLYSYTVLESLFFNDFDTDIVSCGMHTYSKKEQHINLPPANISLYTFAHGSLPHSSSLIKRRLFDTVGLYHEHYKIISDWCFFIEALIIYNCSYTNFEMILSSFNRFGISSTSASIENRETMSFLESRFPRIMEDYKVINDEATFNTLCWVGKKSNFVKKSFAFPFRVFNRIMRLRNSLQIVIGVKKI